MFLSFLGLDGGEPEALILGWNEELLWPRRWTPVVCTGGCAPPPIPGRFAAELRSSPKLPKLPNAEREVRSGFVSNLARGGNPVVGAFPPPPPFGLVGVTEEGPEPFVDVVPDPEPSGFTWASKFAFCSSTLITLLSR